MPHNGGKSYNLYKTQHSNTVTVTQYLLKNVTNAQTLKSGTRNDSMTSTVNTGSLFLQQFTM